MAREPSRGGKTESLTIRLDPKTRFMLDYVSRVKGQPLTVVIERAITETADALLVENPKQPGEAHSVSWRDLWSVIDGERALKIATIRELYPGFEEEKRLAFCKEHWPFFWTTATKVTFISHFVDILWPNIDQFVQLHDDQKTSDYFAAGKAMQAALQAAKVKAPDWPPKPIPPPTARNPPPPGARGSRDLDDDIPF